MVKKIILLGLLVVGLHANAIETVDVKVCVDTTKHADKSFKQVDEILVSMAQEEGFNSLYNRELGKENKNALTDHHRKDLIVKVNEQLDEGNNFCNSATVSIKKDRLQYYLPQKVSKDRICHKDANLSPAKLKEAAALKGYKALISEITEKEISDDLAKKLVHNYQRDDGKLYRAQGAYCFGASGEVVPFEVEMGKDVKPVLTNTNTNHDFLYYEGYYATDDKQDGYIKHKFKLYVDKDKKYAIMDSIRTYKEGTIRSIAPYKLETTGPVVKLVNTTKKESAVLFNTSRLDGQYIRNFTGVFDGNVFTGQGDHEVYKEIHFEKKEFDGLYYEGYYVTDSKQEDYEKHKFKLYVDKDKKYAIMDAMHTYKGIRRSIAPYKLETTGPVVKLVNTNKNLSAYLFNTSRFDTQYIRNFTGVFDGNAFTGQGDHEVYKEIHFKKK